MSKTKIISILIIILLGLSHSVMSQTKKEANIKTRFHCANGKALLEKELAKETGVYSVSADINTKIVTISYNTGATDEKKLIEAIEKIGYETEYTPPGKKINQNCPHEASKKCGK